MSNPQEQPRTLGWLIEALTWHEGSAPTAAPQREPIKDSYWRLANGGLRDDARARLSAEIDRALGIYHIRILCGALDNSDGLTAANVVRLRETVCRVRACTCAEAVALTLDEAADVLDKVGAPPDAGLMSCKQLAKKHDVPFETLRGRLRTWMSTHEDDWKEVTDRRPREVRYLYKEAAVLHIIDDLKKKAEN